MPPDRLENPARIRIRRRIEWIDTDAAGIYHWSTVIRLTEAAEAELFAALGVAATTFGAMPRLKAGFEFRRPLRFNDRVTVELAVRAVGRSSVRYAIVLTDDEQQVAAEGELTTCLIDPESWRAVAWPEPLRTALTNGGEQQPERR